MREYESIFIINPGADENSLNKVMEETQSFITSNGYNVKKAELWGKKKIAYEIKGYNDGFFVFLNFEADPGFISQLSRFYHLSEAIIKHTTVRSNDKANQLPISARPNRPEDEDEDKGFEDDNSDEK